MSGRDPERSTPHRMTSHFRATRPLAAITVACVLSVVLASCGSSKVVREGGTSAPRVSAPKHGQSVTVQKGDNLYRLAVNNGISPLDLAMWNSVQPPYTIYPGQRLRLYPSAGSGGARVATGTPTTVARPPTSASGRRVEPTQAPPQPTGPAPATSAIGWRWPADGNIVARYVAGDPTRQGIDLAGRAGQPVRAAGDGVVVYSGSGLVGYGELVIVKHDEQWLSAYGHNRRRMVAEGERVKAGQQIAEMGRTGADRDMLHFEIRYNGKPVDPLRYLPTR